MKKGIGYLGISAAALLAVTPIFESALSSTNVNAMTEIPVDTVGDDGDGTVTPDPDPETVEVKGTFTDTVHVKDGSSVSDFIDNMDPDTFVFEDSDGNTVNGANPRNGGLFDSADEAWKSITKDGNGQTPESDIGDTFDLSKRSEYYQLVYVGYPSTEIKNFIKENWNVESNWTSDGNSGIYKLFVNGEEVPQQSEDSWAIEESPVKINVTNSYLHFIRKVVVDKVDSGSGGNNSSNNNSNGNSNNIKPALISGVVTTNNDKDFYTLYNDQNKQIDNHAIAKNITLKVDQVRTINGVKQYRVATDEWINASDVDFVENGELPEELSVQKLDTVKKIDLSSSNNHYGLYNSKKKIATNRALAGGTSWLVDKIGTDEYGNIYYGVSTDEYVKADDRVSISK